MEHAVATAERLGLPAVSMQVHVNLIRTDAADTVLPAAERFGVGALPTCVSRVACSPASYRRDEPLPQDSRYASMPVHWPRERWLTDQAFDRAEALKRFAASHGVSLLEVALSGLAAMPAVASIIAGATRPEHARANARAVGWSPSPEELADLRAVA